MQSYRFVVITILSFGMVTGDEYMKIKADYIRTCQIKDPKFTECSTDSIQKIFTKLVTGIDGFDGFQTLDPMKLNRIKILQGDGPVSINSTLTKALITGFANVKIVRSKVSPIDYSWDTKIYLPKMRIDGQYQMSGRILVIPLNGHGRCFIEPSEMQISLKTKTHLYENYGHIFYNVTDTKVDYTIKGLKLRLDNLFEGVPALEESTNAYLNANWMPVSEALKPIIEKSIEDILLNLMNKVFHYIPADYLISDIPRPSELYG